MADQIKIHKVVNGSHTTPFYEHPDKIAEVIPDKLDSVITCKG